MYVDTDAVLDIDRYTHTDNVIQRGGDINVIVDGTDNITYASGMNQNGSGFLLESGHASGFILNKSGWMRIISSGYAEQTSVNSGGVQYVSSGLAENTYLNGGTQQVYSGGSAQSTYISNGGTQNLSGGMARETAINFGTQNVYAGGIASGTVLFSRGSQNVRNSGLALQTMVSSGGIQNINGGTASGTVLASGGLQYVNSGRDISTVISSGGSAYISGGTTIGTLVQSSGYQYVSRNAIASNTYLIGYQTIHSGASAFNVTAASGGYQHVYGVAVDTILDYGWQNVENGGIASGTVILSGYQNVHGGIAKDTVISGGGQHFFSGTAISAVVKSGGSQYFFPGNAIASNTTIEAGGVQSLNYGRAVGTIINSGGFQEVGISGTDINASVNGMQNVSGLTVNAVVRGNQNIYSNGLASGAAINSGGLQNILHGGTAGNTVINMSGLQTVSGEGLALNAIVNSNGRQHISSGGRASGTVINNYGTQNISTGGYSVDTTVSNGGIVSAASGAIVSGIIQKSGGDINADVIGTDNDTLISGVNQNGASIILSNGVASNFVLNQRGLQNVYGGGIANSTEINSGGMQTVSSGTANSTVINRAGQQIVSDGGTANNAIVNSNGDQKVSSGGIANGTVISKGGDQWIYDGGTASGTVISKNAEQWLYSGGSALNTTANGNMWVYSGAYASGITADKGGIIYATGDVVLRGNTVLNKNGSAVITRAAGQENVPARLTIQNLSGNGGTIDMQTMLSNPSLSDQVIIAQSHSSGNTLIHLKNNGTPVPLSSPVLLVKYNDGASVSGTFSLKGGKWDIGMNSYVLTRGGDSGANDYYLTGTEEKTPLGKTITDVPKMAGTALKVTFNSLQKRLGELRMMGSEDDNQGTWGRSYYKSITVKGENDTDMTVYGTEAGYDYRLGDGLYLGLMAGTMSAGDIKSEGKVSGSGSGFSGGAYMTYLSDSDWFMDFTLRGGTNKMDMSVYSESEDAWLNFSPERSFISFSAEYGKSFDLTSRGEGWKFEPKAEMQYMSVGSAKASVENGLGNVEYEGSGQITAIGTVNAAYSFRRANGLLSQPYAEIMYSQNIGGEENIKYSGNTEKTDNAGGTFEARLGINMQVSPQLYWHAAASIEAGSKISAIGADAGIRYMFGKGKSESSEHGSKQTSAVRVDNNPLRKSELEQKDEYSDYSSADEENPSLYDENNGNDKRAGLFLSY